MAKRRQIQQQKSNYDPYKYLHNSEPKKQQDSPGSIIVGFILALCFFLLVLSLGGAFNSSSSSGSSSKEQRCWYCGKVIVNSQGTPIHKSGGKCDYCGKSN